MHFDLRIGAAPARRVELPAEGLYSVYNALAASAAASALGVAGEPIIATLGEHRAAFGRQEQLTVNGRRVRILLGKNPAGMNQALRTLQRAGERHHLLVALNDGIADGTDVSWIWDTDWEAQAPHCASLTIAGQRADELALRLEYAGFPAPREPIAHDLAAALDCRARRAAERLRAGHPADVHCTHRSAPPARADARGDRPVGRCMTGLIDEPVDRRGRALPRSAQPLRRPRQRARPREAL